MLYNSVHLVNLIVIAGNDPQHGSDYFSPNPAGIHQQNKAARFRTALFVLIVFICLIIYKV